MLNGGLNPGVRTDYIVYPEGDERRHALQDKWFAGCPDNGSPDQVIQAGDWTKVARSHPIDGCPLNHTTLTVSIRHYHRIRANVGKDS